MFPLFGRHRGDSGQSDSDPPLHVPVLRPNDLRRMEHLARFPLVAAARAFTPLTPHILRIQDRSSAPQVSTQSSSNGTSTSESTPDSAVQAQQATAPSAPSGKRRTQTPDRYTYGVHDTGCIVSNILAVNAVGKFKVGFNNVVLDEKHPKLFNGGLDVDYVVNGVTNTSVRHGRVENKDLRPGRYPSSIWNFLTGIGRSVHIPRPAKTLSPTHQPTSSRRMASSPTPVTSIPRTPPGTRPLAS